MERIDIAPDRKPSRRQLFGFNLLVTGIMIGGGIGLAYLIARVSGY